MRNFLITLATFPFLTLFTACGVLLGDTEEENSCDTDSTYAESVNQEWQGIQYALPWCWTASNPSGDQLILIDGDSEDQVFIHYHTPDPETLGHMREYTDPEGATLYVEYTSLENHEIQLILDSITWPNP